MGIWFHAPGRWKCWFNMLFSLFQWTQCCFLQALLRVGRKMQLWRNFFLNISQTFLPCGSCTGSILVDSLVLLPLPIVTRGLYTLQHCTTALALACGGKKIGWRAIPQMFTSPTCPQAFRLVTYLSFLFFLFQIQIQIHTNTNTHTQTQLEYWDIDYLHCEFRSTIHLHFHEVQAICRRHGWTINEITSLKGSYV